MTRRLSILPTAWQEVVALDGWTQRAALGLFEELQRDPTLGQPVLVASPGHPELPLLQADIGRGWIVVYWVDPTDVLVLAVQHTDQLTRQICLDEAVERWATMPADDPRRDALEEIISRVRPQDAAS